MPVPTTRRLRRGGQAPGDRPDQLLAPAQEDARRRRPQLPRSHAGAAVRPDLDGEGHGQVQEALRLPSQACALDQRRQRRCRPVETPRPRPRRPLRPRRSGQGPGQGPHAAQGDVEAADHGDGHRHQGSGAKRAQGQGRRLSAPAAPDTPPLRSGHVPNGTSTSPAACSASVPPSPCSRGPRRCRRRGRVRGA